jgi:hypothetical protein
MIMPASLNRSNCAFHCDLRRLVTTPTANSGLKENILIVQREIRGEWVGLNDIMAVKKKNMKLQRLSRTAITIHTYCSKHRINI